MQRFSFASKIGREGRKRKEEGISYSIKPNNPRPVINTRRTNAWITRHIVCTVSLPVPWRDSALFIHAGFDGASNCRLRWIPSLEMALGIPKVPPRHRPSRDRNCHRLLLDLGWNGKKSMGKIFISRKYIRTFIPFTGFIDRNILT